LHFKSLYTYPLISRPHTHTHFYAQVCFHGNQYLRGCAIAGVFLFLSLGEGHHQQHRMRLNARTKLMLCFFETVPLIYVNEHCCMREIKLCNMTLFITQCQICKKFSLSLNANSQSLDLLQFKVAD